MRHQNLNELFTSIANAIRELGGASGNIVADDFPDVILGMGKHVWNKYNCSSTTTYVEKTTSVSNLQMKTQNQARQTQYTFDSSTGLYTVADANGNYQYSSTINTSYPYHIFAENVSGSKQNVGNIMYKITSFTNSMSGPKITGTKYYSEAQTTYIKGSTSYGTVESKDENAYPDNGRHTDGYWYVKVK